MDISNDPTQPRCAIVSPGNAQGTTSFPVARFMCQTLHDNSDLITLLASDDLVSPFSFYTTFLFQSKMSCTSYEGNEQFS